jgi:energy-coupling factor transporter ATP-binding protein EcfA2
MKLYRVCILPRLTDQCTRLKVYSSADCMQDSVNALLEEVSQGQERVCIAAVGPSSCGKSALVNTVASFLSNSLELVAGAGSCGAADGTIQQHMLWHCGKALNWRICEPPGALIDVCSTFQFHHAWTCSNCVLLYNTRSVDRRLCLLLHTLHLQLFTRQWHAPCP